jgi:hypothetical protein
MAKGSGWLAYAAARRGRAATVLMPWTRRGDFQRLIREVGTGDAPRRLAWRRVRGRTRDFHLRLIEALRSRSWLRVTGLDALPSGPLRLRAEDGSLAGGLADASLRIVDRRTTVGLQLARFIASALTPEAKLNRAQRDVADAVRAAWPELA